MKTKIKNIFGSIFYSLNIDGSGRLVLCSYFCDSYKRGEAVECIQKNGYTWTNTYTKKNSINPSKNVIICEFQKK